MAPRYFERGVASPDEANARVAMPYGMTADGLVAAINDVYAYLHAVNVASVEHGYGRLEELMQPAGFSGLLSQPFMRALARAFENATPGLTLNQ